MSMDFSSLGLSKPLLQAIEDSGYVSPTEVQTLSIPAILNERRDVLSAAQTGTGKTASFTLPILEILSKTKRKRGNFTRSLILVPTRELAMQVQENVQKYGAHLSLRCEVVFGGVAINPQMIKLKGGVDILVATPGRLLDLYSKNAIKFDELKILVLDEADRMLDLGFIEQIREISNHLPKERQNLLFSATFSNEVRELSKTIVRNPLQISAGIENSKSELVDHYLYPLDQEQKTSALIFLMKDEKWEQALVFCSTKHGADDLVKELNKKGMPSLAIHGNKSQVARTKALKEFKDKNIKILVATEIISRGIDINQSFKVVNYDLPRRAEGYIHRIGRTGRAGKSGAAISFVNSDEYEMLQIIERLLQELIPRKLLKGFTPKVMLAESVLNTKPFKKKRPKKKKKLLL
jgi:ATP-dependent RNA helicase RhlE